jgi:hypothetical protein
MRSFRSPSRPRGCPDLIGLKVSSKRSVGCANSPTSYSWPTGLSKSFEYMRMVFGLLLRIVAQIRERQHRQ